MSETNLLEGPKDKDGIMTLLDKFLKSGIFEQVAGDHKKDFKPDKTLYKYNFNFFYYEFIY